MSGFGGSRGSRCTDEMQALDVRALERQGLLRAGTDSTWPLTRRSSIAIEVNDDSVYLLYQNRSWQDGGWNTVRTQVMLEHTPCRFGGSRVWWRCPGAGCGRRVAVLYGGRMFACRRCHGLTYRSQRVGANEQTLKQLKNLRRRLWPPGYSGATWGKPKGMHWKTFWRLYSEYNALQQRAIDLTGEAIEALGDKIARITVPRT